MATLNLENIDLNHRKMGGWLTTVKLQFPALKVSIRFRTNIIF